VTAAIAMTPLHAGVVTEDGSTTTSNWGTTNSAAGTTVMSTPALAGDFYWTSHDYLGEAAGLWPQVGSTTGILDRMGTPKTIAASFRSVWGATAVPNPATGTNASKIVVSADHATLLTDPNDVVYIKATIADANGNIVTAATNPVSFTVTGPGAIIAVDSGSVMAETFRGTQRNAFGGLAFAIIQATGTGAITVSAASGSLTAGSATVQGTAGTFAPCSTTCD
jgi:beta-galactosidase